MSSETFIDISLFDGKVSPVSACRFLESMGIRKDDWPSIMAIKTGRHAQQALITIAMGEEPQSWPRVCQELREKTYNPK